VIDAKSALGLPLMHHLMQHGVLDLGPRVPDDVTPADDDIQWAPRSDFHRELSQPGAHAA
jgi:hypothetical protein